MCNMTFLTELHGTTAFINDVWAPMILLQQIIGSTPLIGISLNGSVGKRAREKVRKPFFLTQSSLTNTLGITFWFLW